MRPDPPTRLGQGARRAVPYAIAVGGFGVSYGVLARSAGMGRLAPIVMSATTFAGSAQFATASLLAAGGGVAAAITAAILLNARYGPIGLSVAPALSGPWWRRLLEAQLAVDESWALAQTDGRVDRALLLGAGGILYLAWLAGTAAGVAFGDVLGDPKTIGLDAAFPALFLALLAPQVRTATSRLAAVAGGMLALVLIPLTRPGVPVIASAAACAIGLRRPRR